MYRALILISLFITLFFESLLGAEITISVSYPDGRPASGIRVQAMGLERGNVFEDNFIKKTDENDKKKDIHRNNLISLNSSRFFFLLFVFGNPISY